MNKCIICFYNLKLIFKYKKFNYYRCSSCGLVSTLPLPSDKSIREHYQRGFIEGNYKFLREYSNQYKRVYFQFAEILEEKLSRKNISLKNLKVLDVGCFTGEFLEIIKNKGADVYGLELQKEAVEIADKKIPNRIFQSDLNSQKISKRKFDIVSLLGVVEHVKDPIALINQSYKLLNKNGIIIIQTPNSSSLPARILKKYWPPYSPIEHIHLFSKKSLYQALSQNGFSEIEFKSHWKKLPIGYVYNMFNIFGPEFKAI